MSSGIVVTGTLRADAQHRRTRRQESLLIFEMTLPNLDGARQVVVRVVQQYGTGESAAYVARSRADRLRRGVRVTAHGLGMQSARGVLVLQHVDHVDEPDLVLRNVTGERE